MAKVSSCDKCGNICKSYSDVVKVIIRPLVDHGLANASKCLNSGELCLDCYDKLKEFMLWDKTEEKTSSE